MNKQFFLKVLYWILPIINLIWVLLLYYSWYLATKLLGESITMELGQMYYEPPMPLLMPIIVVILLCPLYLYLLVCYIWHNKWVICCLTIILILPFLYDFITGHYFDGSRKIGTDILILSAYTLSFFPWLGLELLILRKIKKSSSMQSNKVETLLN